MTFYDRFAANMHALGLPAPRTWFDSALTTTLTVERLSKVVHQYGTKVTVRELLFTVPAFATASVAGEFALIGAGLLLTAYLAACVGSLLVATGQSVPPAWLPSAVWREVPHVRARLRGQR